MTLQECITKLKQAHPDLYPLWYIEDQGKYLFNLLKRGVPKEEAVINLYAVDPESGLIAGPIPVMSVYGNPELAGKLRNPHMCSGEEQQAIKHVSPETPGDFLMHYGIKGQKWGIRRFQNEDGTLTIEGKKRYGQDGNPDKGESKDKSNSGGKKPGLMERARIRQAEYGEKWFEVMEKPMPDTFKREETKQGGVDKGRIATEAVLTVVNPLNAVMFAADGIGAAMARKKLDTYFKEREGKSTLDPKTGLYMKKDGSYDEKQDLAAVNPGFMNMNTNTKNNCMLCTTTYEMRRRGYDVTAQLDSVGYGFADLKRWFPKAQIERTSRFDENGKALKSKEYIDKTMNNLLKQGDGARGNMMVLFSTGGAHSIFYEVQNGKVIFMDGQANMVIDGKRSLTVAHQDPVVFLAGTIVNSYARLDNVQPDLKKIIEECVR